MDAFMDDGGRLVLPPDAAARWGLVPGARVHLEETAVALQFGMPAGHLAKLYVEPTNCCNLTCRTCVRNLWDEPLGHMSADVFTRLLSGLSDFSPPPSIFFGGIGEPLSHPRIADMVAGVKALGCTVELITNGTLLTSALGCQLVEAGLDRLWVSLDGARPESYADVRLGAALPTVLANLARFRDSRRRGHNPKPEIGIAFVAMRRNIDDMPQLLHIADRLGATQFMATNVLPYSAELRGEILYEGATTEIAYLRSPWVPRANLPKMDIDSTTRSALYGALRSSRNITFAGMDLGAANDHCPFIERGAGVVGWDGAVSPCLPLLHTHSSYLDQRQRTSRRYVVGNVLEQGLAELWRAPEHIAFRERVQRFSFSPCTSCGGCGLSLSNEEDCVGNGFPTCGGCLWAQGVIQCP